MLRKFFAAVVVAVFVLGAQIASAETPFDFYDDAEWIFENPDDWVNSKIWVNPKIRNKAELFRHIEAERRQGNTKIYATFVNGFKLNQLRDSDGKGFNDLANYLIMASFSVTVERATLPTEANN